MPTSLFLAGWTVAVVLCLYAFRCFWEAHRADLAAVAQEHILEVAGGPHSPAVLPSATAYRARGRAALAASATLALAVLLLAP
jgi:hypothetical protein